MQKETNTYVISALLIGIIFHGTTVFYNLEGTYDALIHLFFGEHYSKNWFGSWNYKWYTGFTVVGYPPLVHQSIGLLSHIAGLKFGLFFVAVTAMLLYVTGSYRFALLLTANRKIAGYASVFGILSSCFIETLHLFGQLPSIVGISLLMHSLPEIYLWIKKGTRNYLISSLSLIMVIVSSHHVTSIFGMVFFIFPLIGLAIMDSCEEKAGSFANVKLKLFFQTFIKLLPRIVTFGFCSLILIIICILPYWINTKNNPITQVSIPHGSRDNFLEVTSSGLVFFMIPWGILLLFMPYLFYRFYSKRFIFFGLSYSLLTLLGTGGTTPLPRMLLGDNAFNILTLDRFTLWASIMSVPIFGEFIYRFIHGDIKRQLKPIWNGTFHRLTGGFFAICLLYSIIFTMSLSYFRPLQPQKIKMLPIVNFMHQDQHDHWRFLPLGFGDQMAWLSTISSAMTVDGNYHSARRLPELTTRAVERLENSKYNGVEGLGSLQQFLTTPEKYNLKYAFSNDKFYDPLLFFCGWQRLRQLENGIMVWEKISVPPLPSILPKQEVPKYQRIMWGVIPISTVVFAIMINFKTSFIRIFNLQTLKPVADYNKYKITYEMLPRKVLAILFVWILFIIGVFCFGAYKFYIENTAQISPKNLIESYYDAIDFKEFERAHSYIDPKSNKSIDQYMLEIAVSDGLLNSYAKLNEIIVDIYNKTDSTAKAKVKTVWITPLQKVKKFYTHNLNKRKGKWFVEPLSYDLDIPPDQLYSKVNPQFFNHGRRRITSEQTLHEDVLKQPVLEVLNAKLIKIDSSYHVIGELQNVDNVPADVVVSSTLFSNNNDAVATYSVKDQIKHKLLPMEISSFRLNFEGIAWNKNNESAPKIFDPDQYTSAEMVDKPVKFNIQCVGNVAITDLYKRVVIQDLKIEEPTVKGILFNSGLQEVTIPQLLVSYYDINEDLIWVDHKYILEGIRQQRKQYFEYEIKNVDCIEQINNDMELISINGLPNKDIAEKYVPERKQKYQNNELIPVNFGKCQYIKIEINNYVGNPL